MLHRLLLACIIISLLISPVPRTQAADFATNPYIYYFSDKINAFIIERADGTDTRVLGRGVMPPGVDRVNGPGWSPSGKWFAWTAEVFNEFRMTVIKTSYLVSTDGTRRFRAIENIEDARMAWSEDSDTLLVTYRTDNQEQENATYTALLITPEQNSSKVIASDTVSVLVADANPKPLWIGGNFVIREWPGAYGTTFLIGTVSGVLERKSFPNVLYNRYTPSNEGGFSYDDSFGPEISPKGNIIYRTKDALVIENLFMAERHEVADPQDKSLEIAWSPDGEAVFVFGTSNTFFLSLKSRRIYTVRLMWNEFGEKGNGTQD